VTEVLVVDRYAREVLGDTVELCHDTHERLPGSMTVQLAKALEPYRLFFLEDSLPPEQVRYQDASIELMAA
jgi:mannonate dehydratase